MSNETDPQRLATLMAGIQQLEPVTPDTEALNRQIAMAQDVIQRLDENTFLQRAGSVEDQIFIIARLQDFAYYEPSAGGISAVVHWCEQNWLRLLEEYGDHVRVLQGLGEAWFFRSQKFLARIQVTGSPSLDSNSSPDEQNAIDTRQAAVMSAFREANIRRQGPDYIEARDFLSPATEYFRRAVTSADRDGSLTGDLLCQAAKASLSLGNIAYVAGSVQHFDQAIRYIHRASRIPGYVLLPLMQSYLDTYGRYVDLSGDH